MEHCGYGAARALIRAYEQHRPPAPPLLHARLPMRRPGQQRASSARSKRRRRRRVHEQTAARVSRRALSSTPKAEGMSSGSHLTRVAVLSESQGRGGSKPRLNTAVEGKQTSSWCGRPSRVHLQTSTRPGPAYLAAARRQPCGPETYRKPGMLHTVGERCSHKSRSLVRPPPTHRRRIRQALGVSAPVAQVRR